MVKNGMRPIHPGEILREEFLIPLGIQPDMLAAALGVAVIRVSEIVHETQGISPEIALRLARYLNTTPEFWLDLQSAFELRKAEQKFGAIIDEEVQPLTLSVES